MLSVTAGFAAILNSTVPLFGALVAYLWLGDKLAPTRIFGLAVGFVGVLVLVWGRTALKDDGSVWAIAAGLGAAMLYGVAANYTKKRLTGVDSLVITTGNLIAATGLLLAPAVIYWPARMPSMLGWMSAIVLAIVCTGIAFVLFFRLISRIGPPKAMTVTYLIPLFGIVWGAAFLGEAITANMTAGCAVILIGTALATGALGPGTFR